MDDADDSLVVPKTAAVLVFCEGGELRAYFPDGVSEYYLPTHVAAAIRAAISVGEFVRDFKEEG